MSKENCPARKPEWLKVKFHEGGNLAEVNGLLSRYKLNTVCREAACPNRGECYGSRTATFMILGALCTRGCAFCAVRRGNPEPVDEDEGRRIAEVSEELGLRYVVLTSVTRDDLPDGGAGHFARVIRELKTRTQDAQVEALVPDFQGSDEALKTVLAAGPDVLNHNVETVPRLYPAVRPGAVYERSLRLLARAQEIAKADGMKLKTKSGLMAGLGESEEELTAVFRDLRAAGCDFLTVGQYLAPSPQHYPVAAYIHPDQFADYRRYALSLGFRGVAAGPFVRSSYKAADMAGMAVGSD